MDPKSDGATSSNNNHSIKNGSTNIANLTNKNLHQLNSNSQAGSVYARRGSNYSISSYSTESSSHTGNTHLSPEYSSSSSVLMKRKRKLMEKNNKACDHFIKHISKHDERLKHQTQQQQQQQQPKKQSESTEEEEEDESQQQDKYSAKTSKLKNGLKAVTSQAAHTTLDTSLGSSISSKSTTSTSSSSISLSSEASLTDVCSKSLIFAPKSLYTYKERLFKKSLSEQKVKEKTDRRTTNVHSIFSPRFSTTHKKVAANETVAPVCKQLTVATNVEPEAAALAAVMSPAVVRSSLNPSKVMDEIIDNQAKSSVGTLSISHDSSANESRLGSSNSRRRRLFDPNTHNYDQAFDSVCQVSNGSKLVLRGDYQ